MVSRGSYVPGIGPSNAKIAFVGEAPGKDEEKQGVPFVGKAGRRLRELSKEAGIDPDEVYMTNIVKYRPPMNNFKRIDEIGVDLQTAINALYKELRELSPNIVVALGDHPLHALTGKRGILKHRGSILEAEYGDFKVLACIHPSAIVRSENPWKKDGEEQINPQLKRYATPEILVCDLLKAKKESISKKPTTPPRNIEIIRDAYQLHKFLESYSNYTTPAIDIEAWHSIPDCISIAFVPHHAVSVPLLPIPGSKGELRLPLSEYVAIYEVLHRFLNNPKLTFVGQNIKFDLEKLVIPCRLFNMYSRGRVAADTSMMMGTLYPELPRALEFSTSIFTNEPFYKDEGREFHPKKDTYQVRMNYNAKDAAVTKEIQLALDKELKDIKRSDYLPHCKGDNTTLYDFYYSYINRLSDFYFDMEAEGLDVDTKRHSELFFEYEKERKRVHDETVALLGTDFNVRSSAKDIPHIIYNLLKLPRRKSLGAAEITALIGNHTEKGSKEAQVLRNILIERQIYTNKNYLEAAWDADGRMRSSWNPTGTETGRSTTSNLGPPLRPFKTKPHKIGLAFQTLPKHGPWAKRIQSIFIAPEGYVFLARDYSQAEARIVALLADDPETLRAFDSTDIHRLTATWLFGGKGEDITDDQRFIGKMGRHSGNYGTGAKRLMLQANQLALKFGINIQLSEKEAKRILDIFHRKTPKIRSVFQKEVSSIVHEHRVLWNPYGRFRQFFGYLKNEEAYAQIPQSTVPDALRMAGLRIYERHPWMRICMEKHDELVWKVPEDRIDEALKISKEEMEVPINFSKCSIPRGELVIPTEAKVGKRLSDLEEVKEN
jgi:uracil-DNA glycosylase family 4